MKPQQVVDEVIRRTTADGYPPEATHKQGMSSCAHYSGFTDNELVARVLIGCWYGKSDLICAMANLADVLQGKPHEASNMRTGSKKQS